MTTEQSILPMVKLSAEEVNKLPEPTRRKFSKVVLNNDEKQEQWVLLVHLDNNFKSIFSNNHDFDYNNIFSDNLDIDFSDAVELSEAIKLYFTYRREFSEKNISRHFVKFIKEKTHSEIMEKIEQDNGKLRSIYLDENKFLTPSDIHELSPSVKSKNPGDLASKLKNDMQIFAVSHEGKDFYPAFQFDNGSPLPVIKKILKSLPSNMSPWQIAFWFWSGNGWLDDRSPDECLEDEENVIFAAEQEGNEIIG